MAEPDEDDPLNSYFTNKIIASDGQEFEGDFFEFCKNVDLFAAEYGIGGCRSLEEFADMIDNTNPILLSYLMKSIGNRHEEMYGDGEDDDKAAPSASGKASKYQGKKFSRKAAGTGNAKAERNNLRNFLLEMGAPRQKLKDAIAEIESGKTKDLSEQFSWITPKVLNDPDFSFKETLAEMSKNQKGSTNFKVSATTLEKRQKEML